MANNTNDQKTKLYMINASIIVAGIMTIVQSAGIKHPKLPFQWGAGTLSVMGISFTTVPIAQIAVPLLMAAYPPKAAGTCGASLVMDSSPLFIGSYTRALRYVTLSISADFNYGYFTSASNGPKGFQPGSKAGGSPCTSALAGVHPFGPNGPMCIPNCQSEAFDYAWGKMLGTLCFCALVPMFISGLNFRLIKKLFPPIVIGPVIMLIGIALIGVGFGDWGGGTFCAQRVIYNGFSNNLMSAVVTNDGPSGFASTDGVSSSQVHHGSSTHNVNVPLNSFGSLNGVQAAPGYSLANATVTFAISNLAADYPAARGTTTLGNYTAYSATGTGLQFTNFACSGAGQVQDVYGASQYVGLGFLTFVTIMSIEVFGSPFLRNCSCVIGLLWSYAAAAWSTHHGQKYVTQDLMERAPGITFLWTLDNSTGPNGFFPISFHPPLIIPFLIVFIITSCETWADTQASMEASRLDTTGKPLQIMRQKGALLNDTLSGILAGLSGVLPLTTFAQNNGIISLTNVASRRVGVACGIWLCILGILSKIGAWIQSIPAPVLGGMTSFLFANVLASGMHILLQDPGALKRRNRFILAATMACGVGVILWPSWARMALWPIDTHMADGSQLGTAKRGVRDAIILILSTGFVFGFFGKSSHACAPVT